MLVQYVILCFVIFVVDAIRDHRVKTYSSFDLSMAQYGDRNVLCLPYLVEERTF